MSEPSWRERLWNLATDNAVGGMGGAATDMLQNGASYGLMNSAPEVGRIPGGVEVGRVWRPSPTAQALGQRGGGDLFSGTAGNNRWASAGRYGGGALSALGLVGGGLQLGQGIGELITGKVGDGLLNTTAGLGSATSGGIGLASMLGVSGTSAAAGLGTTVAAAGAAPIAAAVGGGAAMGITLGQRANSYMADTGLLGRNSDGSGRSWSDWAGDSGVSAYSAAREAGAPEWLAHTAGIGTTLGASVAALPGAMITGVAGLATDAGSLLADGASAAWDRATSW